MVRPCRQCSHRVPMMRRVLLFALTSPLVRVRGYYAECVADFHQSLTATYSLPQFVPPRDLQGLFEPDPTKPAMDGGKRLLSAELSTSWNPCMFSCASALRAACDACILSVATCRERETGYCLLHSVGEAKKQQFPRSVQMQAWFEGLRVLESNLLHWLDLPLAR